MKWLKRKLQNWLGITTLNRLQSETSTILALQIKTTRDYMEATKPAPVIGYAGDLAPLPQAGDVIVPTAVTKGYGRPD